MLRSYHSSSLKNNRKGASSVETGWERKREGLEKVEKNSKEFLAILRQKAEEIAREKGQVSIDELRAFAEENCLRPHHPNAWGAIFRGRQWVVCGEKHSKWKTNNARRINVYSLREKIKDLKYPKEFKAMVGLSYAAACFELLLSEEPASHTRRAREIEKAMEQTMRVLAMYETDEAYDFIKQGEKIFEVIQREIDKIV